jgi:hypothetical protein
MTWLFWHDVWPAWTAQDVPRGVVADWVEKVGQNQQTGLFNERGRRLGTIWSTYVGTTAITREDIIRVEELPGIGSVQVDVESTFTIDGVLDEFAMDVFALGAHRSKLLHLAGERFPTQFVFTLDAGKKSQIMKFDRATAGLIADAFQPFNGLPNLEVGQTWRMQVFNPMAVLLNQRKKFTPMLVSVTGKEDIDTRTGMVSCYVVEAGSVKAWVDELGVSVRQEVSIPLLGKVTLLREPFDMDSRHKAKFGGPTLLPPKTSDDIDPAARP